MNTPKGNILTQLADKISARRLERLASRMQYKNKEMELKAAFQKNSHSLLWVWEFSKKAVLICFVFYMIVQVYAMVVMVKYCDFTYLSDLINQAGEILKECVFAYLIKAGVENIGKIFFARADHAPSEDNEPEESVG